MSVQAYVTGSPWDPYSHNLPRLPTNGAKRKESKLTENVVVFENLTMHFLSTDAVEDNAIL